jgi:hypothetical protein
MTGRLKKNVLLLGLVVVMINLPFVHSTWQKHRLGTDGVDVTGVVVAHDVDGDERTLTFAVAATDDQPAFGGTVGVDQKTYDAAVASQQVEVRVLPGSTTVWEVDGAEGSNLGLVITLVADLLLVLLVLLVVRYGARLRQEMVLVATQDLERCPPGSVLDQVDGLRFVVCGEVEEIEDDAVVLDLGDRRVRVILDGHHNPADYQQPVRATGTMQS